MSLIGNIEDLSLPDILQIISLSKKSGVLTINRGDEEGKIYLRRGMVVLTFSQHVKRNIGSILLEKGLISKSQLSAALMKQKESDKLTLLGAILVDMEILDRDTLEKIVQEQIEDTIFYFLTWQEGTFKFELREIDTRHEVGIDPNVFISQKGIDTQWLILEGTRIIDEKRKELPCMTVPAEMPGSPEEVLPSLNIILVDDDDYFNEICSDVLSKRGVSIQKLSGVTTAMQFLDSAENTPGMIMVVDVVMPTSDGRGFLGGVELAGHISANHRDINLRIITAYPDDSIREQLKEMDIPDVILKPDVSGGEKLLPEMEEFADRLMDSLRAVIPESRRRAPEIKSEDGRGSLEAVQNDITETVGRIKKQLEDHDSLRSVTSDLIEEIRQVPTLSEIGLIILRLASEIFERAILFRVFAGEARGLGGFGFEARMMEYREGLRNLTINIKDSPSIRQSVENLEPLKGLEYDMQGDDLISMVIGSPASREWIIIPAKGVEGTALLLYGDKGSSGAKVTEGKLLSDFLGLAGQTMEKLVMEREQAGGNQ